MIKDCGRGVIPPSASGMRRPAMWLWAVLLAAAAAGLEAQSTAPSVPPWKDATFDKVGKRIFHRFTLPVSFPFESCPRVCCTTECMCVRFFVCLPLFTWWMLFSCVCSWNFLFVLAMMGSKKLRPQATVAEGATVAYNYEAFFGTRYRHVDAPSACTALKESHVPVAVAAHA